MKGEILTKPQSLQTPHSSVPFYFRNIISCIPAREGWDTVFPIFSALYIHTYGSKVDEKVGFEIHGKELDHDIALRQPDTCSIGEIMSIKEVGMWLSHNIIVYNINTVIYSGSLLAISLYS